MHSIVRIHVGIPIQCVYLTERFRIISNKSGVLFPIKSGHATFNLL